MLAALGLSVDALAADAAWDLDEVRLDAQLRVDENHKVPERRAAAGRLRPRLVLGGGTGQTKLAFDDEVDFGRTQVKQCEAGQALFADVQFLGYHDLISDIAGSSQGLAVAVGRAAPGPRPAARAAEIREAVQAAARTFSAVFGDHEEFLAVAAEGSEEHALLKDMRLSLQQLLDRSAVQKSPTAGGQSTQAQGSPPAVADPAAPAAPVKSNQGGNPFID